MKHVPAVTKSGPLSQTPKAIQNLWEGGGVGLSLLFAIELGVVGGGEWGGKEVGWDGI